MAKKLTGRCACGSVRYQLLAQPMFVHCCHCDDCQRLRQHQHGENLATSHRGPWKLIYYEAYTEREDAEGREKFLKSGAGRRFLRTQLRHYLRVKGFASRSSD
jgi:hypothetical protein